MVPNNATNIRVGIWHFSPERCRSEDPTFVCEMTGVIANLSICWRYVAAKWVLVLCADGSEKMLERVGIDWSWSIDFHCDESELITIASQKYATDPRQIKCNKLAKRRYVTSAAVNLMIYTGGRKTNEWIHLARVRTYGATWNKHSWIFMGITPMASASTSPISVSAR